MTEPWSKDIAAMLKTIATAALDTSTSPIVSQWRSVETPPPDGAVVVVFYANEDFNGASFGPVRDYVERCELGWFEAGRWWQAGTGHDMHEHWAVECGHVPTHWMQLPAAPCDSDTLPTGEDRETGLRAEQG